MLVLCHHLLHLHMLLLLMLVHLIVLAGGEAIRMSVLLHQMPPLPLSCDVYFSYQLLLISAQAEERPPCRRTRSTIRLRLPIMVDDTITFTYKPFQWRGTPGHNIGSTTSAPGHLAFVDNEGTAHSSSV